MDWIRGLFTAPPGDMSRIGLWGLAVMLAGIVLVISAGKMAERIAGGKNPDNVKLMLKLAGALLVMIGALGAMKIIG